MFELSVAVLGESRNGLGIFARRGTWRFRVVELKGSRHRGTWHNPHSRALVGEDLGVSKAKQQKKASGLGVANSRPCGPRANNKGEEAALGAVDAGVLATLLYLFDAESFRTAPAATGGRWRSSSKTKRGRHRP